jgi:hypothetical protein
MVYRGERDMPDDLKALRDKLRSLVTAAWAVEGAKDFKTKLEETFPADAKDKYRECIDGPTPRDCLRGVAKELGIEAAYEGAWADAPAALVTKLEQVKTAWTAVLRDKIIAVIEKLDIPDLYALCMAGDFTTVVEKAGLPTQPGSFRECAREVAKAKKLRKELRAVWGKGTRA